MGRSVEAQSGNIVWNGKGFFHLQTGRFAFPTANTSNVGGVVAPCDAEIVAAYFRSLASATGASAKFNIALNGNASGLLTYKSLQGILASGVVDLMLASTWVASASKKVKKGDYIAVGLKKGTLVGSGAITLVFAPR